MEASAPTPPRAGDLAAVSTRSRASPSAPGRSALRKPIAAAGRTRASPPSAPGAPARRLADAPSAQPIVGSATPLLAGFPAMSRPRSDLRFTPRRDVSWHSARGGDQARQVGPSESCGRFPQAPLVVGATARPRSQPSREGGACSLGLTVSGGTSVRQGRCRNPRHASRLGRWPPGSLARPPARWRPRPSLHRPVAP